MGWDTGIGIYVLKGECPVGDVRDSNEGTPEWVPFADVINKPLVEDLYQLLPRVLVMKPGDHPFSAHSYYDEQEKLIVRFS